MSRYPHIAHLDTLTFGGLKNGVKTLRKLLQKLGNPQDSFSVFHVAGTNGKGSTCQMISQVLWKEFGYTVGLTISPHLIYLNERVQINGIQISNEDLNEYLGNIYELTKKEHISLSFFEHMTLVAFLYFRDKQVDYAVVEVGLGGKHDATNVFTKPLATLITTISHDHHRILGSTLMQIFRNKAGILKKDVPCFTRLNTPLMHYAAQCKGTPVYTADNLTPTNLAGTYQQQNAGLVFHCLTTLGRDPERVKHGLTKINNPGRTQWLSDNLLIDGAHNEAGVQVFSEYVRGLQHNYTTLVTIFGSTKTREEYPGFFVQLIGGETNYLVSPRIEHRTVPPTNYQHHLTFDATDGGFLSDLRPQLPLGDTNTLIIIYGSLYLVGEAIDLYHTHSSGENA